MPSGIANVFGRVWRLPLPGRRFSSRRARSFCPAFRRLSWTSLVAKGSERFAVLMRSSNLYPPGNCDSPKPETGLRYLTRLGMVSLHPLPLSSCFASLMARERQPEEQVNTASGLQPLRAELRGEEPTSLARPFPSRLGLSLEARGFLSSAFDISSCSPRPALSYRPSLALPDSPRGCLSDFA